MLSRIEGVSQYQGTQNIPEIPAEIENKHLNRKVGWETRDTLSSYQDAAAERTEETVEKTKTATWWQWCSAFFGKSPKPIEGAELPSSTSVAELSESQKKDLAQIKSKFDLLMEKLEQDCPGMDMDQVMELLFYLSQETKKEEFEMEKGALQDKYRALKQHREEYQRLSEELAIALKKGRWWSVAQEASTLGSACLAASAFGPGWAIPILCLAVGRLASSYHGYAVEHAVARLAAKTGIISENMSFGLIQTSVSSLCLLGAALSGGADPSKIYKALKQVVTLSQVMTGVCNEGVSYTSEKRRGEVQFVSSQVQEGQKSVDRAVQDVASCSKRASQASSSIGAWARQLDGHMREIMR